MTTKDHARAAIFWLSARRFGGFPRMFPADGTETAFARHNRRFGALVLACALVLHGATGALRAEVAEVSVTAFRDEFDTFDRSFWYISDGWTNGPHQNCEWSERAVDIAGGVLKLSFLPGGEGMSTTHVCGEIQSNAIYHHGTYEARIRTGKGSGLNAAFFTYIGPVHKKPHDEIDVEILTRDTGSVWLNTYVSGKQQNGKTAAVDPPTDTEFHTYGFTWAPDGIRWFIDGREVHRADKNLPVTPQKIYLSHWGSDTLVDWMGPFTPPDGPVVMEIDWIAFTPLGAACQFPESALCQTR